MEGATFETEEEYAAMVAEVIMDLTTREAIMLLLKCAILCPASFAEALSTTNG